MSRNRVLNKQELGLRIWHLIDNNNLSYSEIARSLGLKSSRMIYRWCSGQTLPSVEHLCTMAVLLNTSMEVICFGE